MRRIRNLVVNHLWWLVLVVAAIMLAVHSFGVQRVVVDNTSLVLLVLVLVSPFVAAIKKIKIGDFEAEIEPEEVKRVARQTEESLPAPTSGDTRTPEIGQAAAAIKALAETDPTVALAKLRIELETRLRRLQDRISSDVSQQKRPAALAYVIRELTAAEIFTPQFGSSLREVIAICNRAIHGEDIRDVDARQIVDSGIDLLIALQREIRDYAATHPVETSVITPAERDEFETGRYRLTTVVPYGGKPERRVYVLTQNELDAFFDSYSEFGEFVVGLEKIT
jgi:hypothetical protein